VHNIVDYWISRKKLVDTKINDVIECMDVEREIKEIMKYIALGGKRLRGTLTLFFTEALGGNVEDGLDASVAIEFVHAASLVHDDIIDGDLIRRGKPTTWLRYGVSKAIIVPHILISKAQIMVEKYGMKALGLTIRAWFKVSLGEYEDIVRGSYYDPNAYERIAYLKTGALFGVAAALGAIAANVSEDFIEQARIYGEKLGVAFQVADDIVDLHKFLRGKLDLRTSPSLNSFIAWILDGKPYGDTIASEVISRAMIKLKNCIFEAIRAGENIVEVVKSEDLKRILEELPIYSVKKMLEEGGLSSSIRTLV